MNISINRITRGLFVIALVIVSSCTPLPTYTSLGYTDVENANLRYHNIEQKISYDFSNDNDNLYIYAASSDYISQAKILLLGFTVWIDKEGKRKRNTGIEYPIEQKERKNSPGTKNRSTTEGETNEAIKMNELHKLFSTRTNNIKLIGFMNKKEPEIINQDIDKPSIHASIIFDDYNILHYKATIPLDLVFKDGSEYIESVSIGLVSGKIELNYAGPARGSSQGARGGGGGRGGASGMSGGGRGGSDREGSRSPTSPEQRSALSEPIETWFKIKLLTPSH